jgi:hypothetical protein
MEIPESQMSNFLRRVGKRGSKSRGVCAWEGMVCVPESARDGLVV